MKIIGLTGGSGSGKTTVSDHIRSLGFDVIDADRISHELSGDQKILGEIREAFGDDVFTDGSLDRKKLSGIVFASPNARNKLELIVTSRVIEEIVRKVTDYRNGVLKASKNAVFLDAPLLFETGTEQLTDEVWLVTADLDKRIDRLSKRDGLTKDEALSRIKSQMSDEEKMKKSDYVFHNDSTIEELLKEVDARIEIL